MSVRQVCSLRFCPAPEWNSGLTERSPLKGTESQIQPLQSVSTDFARLAPNSIPGRVSNAASRFVELRLILGVLLLGSPVYAAELDLDPQVIQNSPVLQRWQKQVPNVTEEIKTDPSFRPRLRIGYSASELKIGIEDLRINRTRLTTSANYQSSNWGADLHYYVRPLGSYLNVAPLVGYRHLTVQGRTIDGANLGLKALFVLSRGGGAEISLTQSWVAPFRSEQTGLTAVSIGYALTHNLRLSTEFQKRNSPIQKESRFGIGLEWMP